MTRLDTSQGPGAMESDRSPVRQPASPPQLPPHRAGAGGGAGGRCAYVLLGPSVRSRRLESDRLYLSDSSDAFGPQQPPVFHPGAWLGAKLGVRNGPSDRPGSGPPRARKS